MAELQIIPAALVIIDSASTAKPMLVASILCWRAPNEAACAEHRMFDQLRQFNVANRNVEQWRRLAPPPAPLDATRKAVLEPSQMILHPHAPEQQNDPQYYDRYRDGTAR
jgi:hypothetical protein